MLGSHETGEGALFPIPNEPLVPRGVVSWIPWDNAPMSEPGSHRRKRICCRG
jgi:hypothetical protein